METFVVNFHLYAIQNVGKHNPSYELYASNNGKWSYVDTANTKKNVLKSQERKKIV